MSQIMAEARRHREQREKGYRERALKIFPHICARCARELAGKRLRELTVHHKDHNHDNNPPDGSNWELLCIYCHDNEHARDEVADWYTAESPQGEERAAPLDSPFARLGDLLKPGKDAK
jgi:hypothetical protein